MRCAVWSFAALALTLGCGVRPLSPGAGLPASPLLGPAPPPVREPSSVDELLRSRIVRAARRHAEDVGRRADGMPLTSPAHAAGEAFAFVRLVLADAGAGTSASDLIALRGTFLRRGALYRNRLPRLGDLVLFAGTGTRPRGPSHVAVVVGVAPDGTLEVIGWRRGVVRRDRVNPIHPSSRRLDGRIVNSFVRVIRRDDPPGTRYLAGELLDGFGDVSVLLPGDGDVAVR